MMCLIMTRIIKKYLDKHTKCNLSDCWAQADAPTHADSVNHDSQKQNVMHQL
jgi:hypothetical protein